MILLLVTHTIYAKLQQFFYIYIYFLYDIVYLVSINSYSIGKLGEKNKPKLIRIYLEKLKHD